MSYLLGTTTSLTALLAYVVRSIAGLEAGGFTEVGARWRAIKEVIAAALATQATDVEQELMTTARVRVCDVGWDEAVGALSKTSLFLAGGDAKASPYAALFGTAKASDLQKLGPAKATVAAQTLLSKLETLNEPKLVALAEELKAKTEALKVAEAADAEAEMKLATHSIERTRLLRQTEALIAETEAKILTSHPGSTELVRAILNPNPARRPARKQEQAETPEAPESEETP